MALNEFPINYEALNGDPLIQDVTLEKQTEILDRIFNRLTFQFQNRQNIADFIRYFAEGFGTVGNENFLLENFRSLATASGVQLDVLGSHLNVRRDGKLDDAYRREIFIHTLIGASSGTRDDIIALTRIHSTASVTRYWDIYPAAFQVFTNGDDANIGTAELVQEVTPAGINSETLVVASHGNEPFVMSETLTDVATLALENDDDFILENSDLLELNLRAAVSTAADYGGGFGEVDNSGNVVSLLNFEFSEAYQIP